MRGDGNARMRPERMAGWQRFGLEHIKRGMADIATLKRDKKCCLIHQTATAGVDDNASAPHLCQCFGVQHMVGIVGIGQ